MDKDKITKEVFEAYEAVKLSGVTNMYDINYVSELSELSTDEIKCIIENYTYIAGKYLN